MTTANRIREKVSNEYAKAITSGTGCCSGTCCKQSPSTLGPTRTKTSTIGYSDDLTKPLPTEAVENSFGCGNPLAFSGVKQGDVVLDLGSGAGLDLLVAAELVGPQGKVIGVDMTNAMIEKAKKNVATAGARNVEVKKGIIEALPVEPSSVDWVISNCVINLSPEKPKVFAEIARVLKPGGQMQVSDIVATDLPAWARKGIGLYAACVAGAWSEEAYIAGLKEAGLVDVEVRERLMYDKSELIGLIGDFLPPLFKAIRLPGGSLAERLELKIADRLAGKIWSAKFYARKP